MHWINWLQSLQWLTLRIFILLSTKKCYKYYEDSKCKFLSMNDFRGNYVKMDILYLLNSIVVIAFIVKSSDHIISISKLNRMINKNCSFSFVFFQSKANKRSVWFLTHLFKYFSIFSSIGFKPNVSKDQS